LREGKLKKEYVYRFPNTTQFPNVIIDEFMSTISGAEFKVLCYIARRTFGFSKGEDSISLKQICSGIVRQDGIRLDAGTGLSRSTAKVAVKSLEERGLIHVERSAIAGSDESEVNRYSIIVEDAPEDAPESVEPSASGGGPKIGPRSENEVGRKSAYQVGRKSAPQI
jgi:DNA-binding MarR family transcriptional regulator